MLLTYFLRGVVYLLNLLPAANAMLTKLISQCQKITLYKAIIY